MTSRLVGDVAGQAFGPGLSGGLTRLVGRHRRVAGGERLAHNMGAGEVVQEPADATTADDAVQPVIDLGVHGNRRYRAWRI